MAEVTGYPGVFVNDIGDDKEVNYIPNEADNAANHQVSLHRKAMDLFLIYQENNPSCNPSTGPHEQANDLDC